MKLTLWEKYLSKEFLKIFALFIGSFYLLYIIIDYSTRAKSFFLQGEQLKQFVLYYLCHFSKRAPILIPFGLLIATTKTLIQFNRRYELVALYMSGISKQRILRPLLLIGGICLLGLYINEHFFLPQTLSTVDKIKGKSIETRLLDDDNHLNQLNLKDGSILIYQSYKPSQEYFFDVLWMTSSDSIYRIKRLYPYTIPPEAHFVDLMVKSESGFFGLQSSTEIQTFSHIDIDYQLMELISFPVIYLPLLDLYPHYKLQKDFHLDRQASSTLTWFLVRTLVPLNCLLVIVGIAPFCMSFDRQLPVFFIYCLGLFGLVTFYMLLDATAILGEHNVFPALICGSLPTCLFGSFIMVRYSKMR